MSERLEKLGIKPEGDIVIDSPYYLEGTIIPSEAIHRPDLRKASEETGHVHGQDNIYGYEGGTVDG